MSKSTVQDAALAYQVDELEPEDLLHFVELDEFVEDWESLGFDLENDLLALQVVIMSDPLRWPVIPATGSLRKLRFTAKGDRGKSGGARVCYAYFPKHWTVLLVIAYDHSEKDTLSPTECKAIKELLKRCGEYLDRQNY